MDILITGCGGQLGAACRAEMPAATGLTRRELDVADRFQCLEKLEALRPRVIINCAAFTNVDACEQDEPACRVVNADGPAHLAEWAERRGVFLVQISTDYVFAGDKPLFEPYVETDVPMPVSAYGRAKRAGERAVLESGAQAAVLRTAWLYGAAGGNFLKTMLRLACDDPARPIRVVNDQFGSPTSARALARQIRAVVQSRAVGLLHASAEGFCSWFDLAERFLTQMHVPHRLVPCSTEDYPTPAIRPRNSILENAVLKEHDLNRFDAWENELEQFVCEHREALLEENERNSP